MNSIRRILERYVESAASALRLKLGHPAYLKLADGWKPVSSETITESWLSDQLGLVSGQEGSWPSGPQHFVDKQLKWELLAHPTSGSQIRLVGGPIGDLCCQYLKSHPKLRLNQTQQVEVLCQKVWIAINAQAILPLPLNEFSKSLDQTALENGRYAVYQDQQPWWVELTVDPLYLIFQPAKQPTENNQLLSAPESTIVAQEEQLDFFELDAMVSQMEIPAAESVCQISLAKYLMRKPFGRQLEPILADFPGRKILALPGQLPCLILDNCSLALSNVPLTQQDVDSLKADPCLANLLDQFGSQNDSPLKATFWRLSGGHLFHQEPFKSASAEYSVEQGATILAQTAELCIVACQNEIAAFEASTKTIFCNQPLRPDLPPQAVIGERGVLLSWKARESSLLGRIGLAPTGLEAHFYWFATGRRPRALSRYAITKKAELAWNASPAGKYIIYLQEKGSKSRLTRIDVDDDQIAGEVDLAIDIRKVPVEQIQLQVDEDGNCALLCSGDLWLTERKSKNCSRESVGKVKLLGINGLSALIAVPPDPDRWDATQLASSRSLIGWTFQERMFPSVTRSKPKFCDLSSLLSVVGLYQWIELCPDGACVGFRNHGYFSLPFIVPSVKALSELADQLREKAGAPSEIDCFKLAFKDCLRAVELRPQSIRLTQYYFDGELHRFPLIGKPVARKLVS